ncbi:TlpA family protein disulfide reductase [Kineococcus gynurae]|uniref:TlpA family protein disulfide reductase n=1 Tax=Kineococcus gynurae TaxID=452979 RepID=A0ABV5LXB5_9ACTN
MTVLIVAVVGLTLVVALLGLLVLGLLRSHAEILRSLHELGAGREDTAPGRGEGAPDFTVGEGVQRPAAATGGRASAAPPVSGETPHGDGVQLDLGREQGPATLVAFLSSGCLTCRDFWDRFGEPDLDLPAGMRLVVVTQGRDRESVTAVRALAPAGVDVVMSSPTWAAYDVPGSPYFVLVAGGRVVGEGSATGFEQVRRLVTQAVGDSSAGPGGPGGPGRTDQDDPVRVDAELRAAGIDPGHPSLTLTPVDRHR